MFIEWKLKGLPFTIAKIYVGKEYDIVNGYKWKHTETCKTLGYPFERISDYEGNLSDQTYTLLWGGNDSGYRIRWALSQEGRFPIILDLYAGKQRFPRFTGYQSITEVCTEIYIQRQTWHTQDIKK